jgi:hypothetical protein
MESTRCTGKVLMELQHSQKILEEQSNIKFNKNPSNGSRVFPCGRTDGQRNRETEMEKITAGFRNFGNRLGTRIAGFLTIFKHATS